MDLANFTAWVKGTVKIFCHPGLPDAAITYASSILVFGIARLPRHPGTLYMSQPELRQKLRGNTNS